MKKYITFLIYALLIGFTAVSCGDNPIIEEIIEEPPVDEPANPNPFFYDAEGGKIYLYLVENKLWVHFNEGTSQAEQAEVFKETGIDEAFASDYLSPIVEVKDLSVINRLNTYEVIDYASYVYKYDPEIDDIQSPSDKIFVSPKEGEDVKAILEDLSIEYEAIERMSEHNRIVLVTLFDAVNSLDVCNKIFESKRVVFAEPNFWLTIKIGV